MEKFSARWALIRNKNLEESIERKHVSLREKLDLSSHDNIIIKNNKPPHPAPGPVSHPALVTANKTTATAIPGDVEVTNHPKSLRC